MRKQIARHGDSKTIGVIAATFPCLAAVIALSLKTMKRRPFLQTLYGSTLAAAFARAEEAPKKLGWALVGLGSLSTNQIAPALLKCRNSRLAAVVTGSPEKGKKWSEQYGFDASHIYSYENFDKIIDDPTVDVIYVVLPNSMHREYVERAAKAGKHVFCEKPMANTPDDCRAMIAACAKAKKLLGVGYRCQFVPHHREAVRLAREQVFGEVKHIQANFGFQSGDPKQWRLRKALAGGGAMMDVGIYALQSCRMLMGEEPIEVSAIETKTDPVKFAEVDETVNWQMKFASGRSAQCTTTYLFNGYNDVTAICTRGKFGLDPAFSYSGLKGFCSGGTNHLDLADVDHFQAEMEAFADAIMQGKSFAPSGEEGLRDLLVIDAIYRSIQSGKVEKVATV